MIKILSWTIISGSAALLLGVFAFSQAEAKSTGLNVARIYPYVVNEVNASPAHYTTERSITSSYTDPKLALEENGITVYPEDHIQSYIYGMVGVFYIDRAPVINIKDGKKTIEVRSWKGKLADVLTEKNIPELGKDDKITPAVDTEVIDGMNVVITRVQETDITETQTIVFKTIEKTDPNLWRGETRIDQEGHNGTKVLTYHIRREDGEEVSRKLTKTEITNAVENRLISHGSKLKIQDTISGRATWYNSKYAAASHLWPKGTHVRITNPANGKSMETVIDDYMESDQSVIDLRLDLFKQIADPYGTMPKLVVDRVLN